MEPTVPESPTPQVSVESDQSPQGLANSWLNFKQREVQERTEATRKSWTANQYGSNGSEAQKDLLERYLDDLDCEMGFVREFRERVEAGDAEDIEFLAGLERERREKLAGQAKKEQEVAA